MRRGDAVTVPRSGSHRSSTVAPCVRVRSCGGIKPPVSTFLRNSVSERVVGRLCVSVQSKLWRHHVVGVDVLVASMLATRLAPTSRRILHTRTQQILACQHVGTLRPGEERR